MQFTYDTYFCEENVNSILFVKSTFRCFELSYSLKVNFFKTKIGGIGLNLFDLEIFSKLLNCYVMSIPCKYL